MGENKFMITPSELDVKKLYDYLCRNCSFNDVMRLYTLLKYCIEGNNEN